MIDDNKDDKTFGGATPGADTEATPRVGIKDPLFGGAADTTQVDPVKKEQFFQDSLQYNMDKTNYDFMSNSILGDRKAAYTQLSENQYSGARENKAFAKKIELFGSADWKNDPKVWEQVRLDIESTATQHGNQNKFIVESIHKGAWEQARSATADEQYTLLGLDLRNQHQFANDASEASKMAQILGLTNSQGFKNYLAEQGIDTSKEADVMDTLSNPFNAMFNYSGSSADQVAKYVDPDWDDDAKDDAYAMMISSEQGKMLVEDLGLTRESMDTTSSPEQLIYKANRLYNERKFSQHAAQDIWGGKVEMFGQMLPSILNDPDTVGELGLAIALGAVSGGAGAVAYGAARAGLASKFAYRAQKIAKGFNTAGRILPTRITGDFIIPGVKALRANEKLGKTSMRLNHAYNNLDQYDNWGTFLLGASADGVVGGTAQWAMNIASVDSANAIVYGEGKVPTLGSFDQFLVRAGMGVGGAITLGSTIRVGFKGLATAGSKSVELGMNQRNKRIRDMDKMAAQNSIADATIRRELSRAGVTDEATVQGVSARIEQAAAVTGVSPGRVAADVRAEMGAARVESMTPVQAAKAVTEAADRSIATQAVAPDAVIARTMRAAAAEAAAAKSGNQLKMEQVESDRIMNEIQTGAIIRNADHDGDTKAAGAASVTTVEAIDEVDIDALAATRTAADAARRAEREANSTTAAARKNVAKAEKKARQDQIDQVETAVQKQLDEGGGQGPVTDDVTTTAPAPKAEVKKTDKSRIAKLIDNLATYASNTEKLELKKSMDSLRQLLENDPKPEDLSSIRARIAEVAEEWGDLREITKVIERSILGNDPKAAADVTSYGRDMTNPTRTKKTEKAQSKLTKFEGMDKFDGEIWDQIMDISAHAKSEANIALRDGDKARAAEAFWMMDRVVRLANRDALNLNSYKMQEGAAAKSASKKQDKAFKEIEGMMSSVSSSIKEMGGKANFGQLRQDAKVVYEITRTDADGKTKTTTEEFVNESHAKNFIEQEKDGDSEDGIKGRTYTLSDPIADVAAVDVDPPFKAEAAPEATPALDAAASPEAKMPTVPEAKALKNTSKAEAKAATQSRLKAEAAERKAIDDFAAKHDMKPEMVSAVVAEQMQWRTIQTGSRVANKVASAFEAETNDIMPIGVARHALGSIDPDVARNFDLDSISDGTGFIKIEDFRQAVRDASSEAQGLAVERLTQDPSTIFMASRMVRSGYNDYLKALAESEESGVEQAIAMSVRVNTLLGNNGLRDYDFRKSGVYLTTDAYTKQALDNMEFFRGVVESAEIETGSSVKQELAAIEADEALLKGPLGKRSPNKTAIQRELVKTFGYPEDMIGEARDGIDLQNLLANHRWLAKVDAMMAEGKLTADQIAIIGLFDPDIQRATISEMTVKIQEEIKGRLDNGQEAFISEVDAYRLMPDMFNRKADGTAISSEVQVGAGLRDAIFNSARVKRAGVEMFDLHEMNHIATKRLASIDVDFNRAQKAAAQSKMADLQGKVDADKATAAERIELSKYINKSAIMNERDFLINESIPGYKAASKAQATAKKRQFIAESNGDMKLAEEKWNNYLLDEDTAMGEAVYTAMFSFEFGISKTARQELFNAYGINPPKKSNGDAGAATDQWKIDTSRLLMDVASEKMRAIFGEDFKLSGLMDGTQGFARGTHVGYAIVEMLGGHRLSGDSIMTREAEMSVRSGGQAEAVGALGMDRKANPLRNMQVRQELDMLEKFVAMETRRFILFNEDGTPRRMEIEESKAVIEYYNNLRNLEFEALKDLVPELPYEQKARGVHLVPRENSNSPLTKWVTPEQRAQLVVDRFLHEPASLYQGIHDDITLATGSGEGLDKYGTTLSVMGLVGPEIAANASGSGAAHGGGAGWQTMAVTPGSIGDWINMRHEAMFHNFAGVADMARTFGMKGLMDIQTAVEADLVAKGMSKTDAKNTAQMMGMADLEDAIRVVDASIMDGKFSGSKFEENLNSWDASSQAVTLAKAFTSASDFKTDTNARMVLDHFKRALGWTPDREGMLTVSQRQEILRTKALQSPEVQEALTRGEDPLIEAAADFYRKTWNTMTEQRNALHPEDGRKNIFWGEQIKRVKGEDKITNAPAGSDNFPGYRELFTDSAQAWDAILGGVGAMGEKHDMAKGTIAHHVRNKLMKRPVMTRSYGAGRGAVAGAVSEFLGETFQLSNTDPGAVAFRAAAEKANPELYKKLVADAEAGILDKSGNLYKFAFNFASALADQKKSQMNGNILMDALDIPEAAKFRDNARALASVAKDKKTGDDLMIDRVEIHPDGTQQREARGPITMDDLHSHRTQVTTDKEGNETSHVLAGVQANVTERAIQVATSRGWDPATDPELLDTLGRWYLRNMLLLEQGGSFTYKDIQRTETKLNKDMHAIVDSGENVDLRLQELIENFATRRDDLTLRGMNNVGYKIRKDKVTEALARHGLTPEDMDPKFLLQLETDARLYASVATAAGRGFTGAGQGHKGLDADKVAAFEASAEAKTKSDSSLGILAMERAVSDEHPNAAYDLDGQRAAGWWTMDPKERHRIAMQLAAQDQMLDFQGTINPPEVSGQKFVEPTSTDMYMNWQRNSGRVDGIKASRQELIDASRTDQPDAEFRADPLATAPESYVNPVLTKTLFDNTPDRVWEGDEDTGSWTGNTPGNATDAGIPQMMVGRYDRTADMIQNQRIAEAQNTAITGVGLTLGEMAVPGTLKIVKNLVYSDPGNRTAAPDVNFGKFDLESDPVAYGKVKTRELITWAQANDQDLAMLATANGREELLMLYTADKVLFDGFVDPASKANRFANKAQQDFEGTDGDAKEIELLEWNMADPMAQRRFVAEAEDTILRELEMLFGGPENSRNKLDGVRDVTKLDNDKVAYPSDNLLDGLAKSALGGPDGTGTGNKGNSDALLGPAPLAGIVLKGDNVIDGKHLIGLMPKTVFHTDFGLAFGAAEQQARFAMHYLSTLHPDKSTSEIAGEFHTLWGNAIERTEGGLEKYNTALMEYKNADVEIDARWKSDDIGSLVSLGSVRDRLRSDDVAMQYVRDNFGIDSPEKVTNEWLMGLQETTSVNAKGETIVLPEAFGDNLSRALTNNIANTDAVLWRTMEQFKQAGRDPKSQPMMRRLWFASVLQTELGRLNTRDGMGAGGKQGRLWAHAPEGDQRIQASALADSRWVSGDVKAKRSTLTWDSMQSKGAVGAIGEVVKMRADRAFAALADSGFESRVTSPIIGFAYAASGRNRQKFESIVRYSRKDSSVIAMDEGTFEAVNTEQIVDEAMRFFDAAERHIVGMDQAAQTAAVKAVEDSMRTDGNSKDISNGDRVRAVLDAMPFGEMLTASGRQTVVADVHAGVVGDAIAKGNPDAAHTDPVFGNGRTLWDETDENVFKARYPQVHHLVTELEANGVFADKAEARKFGMMLLTNWDVLSNILPGIKFSYAGEAGTARMSTEDAGLKGLVSRIEVLSDMQGMDAVSAFDIIAHEIGHVVVHRAMAKQQGVKGGGPINPVITSLKSEFRNQLLKGDNGARARYLEAFQAIHGAEKGNEYFNTFLQEVLADPKGGRSEYSPATQEFIAQLYSWNLLSRTQDMNIVTPFMKVLTAVHQDAGMKIRKVAKVFEGRKSSADGVSFIEDGHLKVTLERLAFLSNQGDGPMIWNGKRQWDNSVLNHAGTSGTLNKSGLAAKQAEISESLAKDPTNEALKSELRLVTRKLNDLIEGGTARYSDVETRTVLVKGALGDEARAKGRVFNSLSRKAVLDQVKLGDFTNASKAKLGVSNIDFVEPALRQQILGETLRDLAAGREQQLYNRETRGGRARSAMATFGEGIAWQNSSAPFKAQMDNVQYVAGMMNGSLGFENRTGSDSTVAPVTLDQIDIAHRAMWGPMLSEGIELVKLAKKHNELIGPIDDAFEAVFYGKNADAKLKALAAMTNGGPQAAEMIAKAAPMFMERWKETVQQSYLTGAMDKSVRDDLLAHPSLPIQMHAAHAAGGNSKSVARELGSGITTQLMDRFKAIDGEDAGYVDAQMLYEQGLLAGWKRPDAGSDRARAAELESQDPAIVDALIETATGRKDTEWEPSGNRVDDYFAASQIVDTLIRHGKLFRGDMPSVLTDAYARNLTEGTMEPGATRGGTPRYADGLNPRIEADKAQLDLLNSGAAQLSPQDFAGMGIYMKARYGGYTFGDSRLIEASRIRSILGADGMNRNPMEIMKKFSSHAFDVLETRLNQEHTGIQGVGIKQLLTQIEAEINSGHVMVKGQLVSVSGDEAKALQKAVNVMRDHYELASGRNPIREDDASNDFAEMLTPALQIATSVMTTPNWTMASVAVEGTANVMRGISQMLRHGIAPLGNVGELSLKQLRDDMHNVGITLPYHMTELGYGHLWLLDDAGVALNNIDPSVADAGIKKAGNKVKRVASFGFEYAQLKNRHMRMLPAQQLLRKYMVGKPGQPAPLEKAAAAFAEENRLSPDKVWDRKRVIAVTRAAGIDDPVIGKALYDMGAFDVDTARRVTGHASKYMGNNTMYDFKSSMDFTALKEGAEYAKEFKASSIVQKMIFNELGRTNLEPGVLNTVNAKQPMQKLWSQLSSYATMFMKNALALSTGAGATSLLTWLVPLMFGEGIYSSMNRMKAGDSPETILSDWETDPMGMMLQVGLRMPILGAGTFLTQYAADNALAVGGKTLGGDGALSSFERSGRLSMPGMPAAQMAIQGFQGVADTATGLYNAAMSEDGDGARQFKKVVVGGVTKFAPVDGRPLWAPALRAITGEWKDAEAQSPSDRSMGANMATSWGAMRAPRGNKRRQSEAIKRYSQTKAAQVIGRNAPRGKAPTAPQTPTSQPKGVSTPPQPNVTGGSPQTGSSSPSGSLGPGSASGNVADMLD